MISDGKHLEIMEVLHLQTNNMAYEVIEVFDEEDPSDPYTSHGVYRTREQAEIIIARETEKRLTKSEE